MYRWLFAAITLALCTIPALADMPTAGPANSGSAGWYRFTDSPGYWGWYKGNALVGRWHAPSATWQEWDGKRWLPASSPPWATPDSLPGARLDRGGINYGLDTSKIGQHGERYWTGGVPHAVNEIGAADDSKLPQVLILDPVKQRRDESFAALTASLAGKARVNAADPTNKDQQPFLTGWKLDQDKRFIAAGAATFIQGVRDPKDGCAPVVSAIYKPMEPAALVAEVGARVSKDYDPQKNADGSGLSLALNWGWIWNNVIWPLILMAMGAGGAKYAMGPKPGTVTADPTGVIEPDDEAGKLVRAIQEYEAARLARVEAEKVRAERDARVKEAILALAK